MFDGVAVAGPAPFPRRGRPVPDLVGRRFGRLLVIDAAVRAAGQAPLWPCRCDCGKSVLVRTSPLVTGRRKSCGCARYDVMDLTGHQYGMLTVMALAPRKDGDRGARWVCRCECGRMTAARARDLRTEGNTTSCGCRIGRLAVPRGDVTSRQRRMLDLVLAAGGSLLQRDVEARLQLDPSRASRNASRLVERGLVVKSRLHDPGRPAVLMVLTLTAAGRAYLAERGAGATTL